MKPRVDIETTIPSYLTARPSTNVILAARQQETREWWGVLGRYEVLTSQLVLDECADGDPDAAADRLAALAGVTLLDATPATDALAMALIAGVPIPAKAAADAGHVALSAVHGVAYLLTWNCRHLANAALRPRIERVRRAAGFAAPVVCTPPELTWGRPMTREDDIMQGIRAYRERFAAEHGYDVRAMFATLRARVRMPARDYLAPPPAPAGVPAPPRAGPAVSAPGPAE